MKQILINVTVLVVLIAFVAIQETSAEIKRNTREQGNLSKIRMVMDKVTKETPARTDGKLPKTTIMSVLKTKNIGCKEVIDAKLESAICAYDCSRHERTGINCKGDVCACPP